MNSDNYHSKSLPISGNEGWQQMELLLNQQLPVQLQFRSKKWLAVAATLLLCISGMFISLPLNAPLLFSVMGVGKDAAPVTNHTNSLQEKNYPPKHAAASYFFNPLTDHTPQHSSPVMMQETWLPGREALPGTAAVITAASIKNGEENRITSRLVNGIDIPAIPAVTGMPATAVVEKNSGNKPYWSLLAGIGVNAVVGTHQHWQPYPVAVARYNISKRWYIAAGVGGYSPVAAGVSGVSKTVYVNDTVNNVQLYKETTTYKPLYYADIPVTAGISLSNKWAVQAGVQVSVLLNKKTTKTTAPYDFQGTAATITPPTAMAERQTETRVPLRTIDYRFVTGIRYTLHKTVIGLDYQQALQPAGKGPGNSSNKVVALSVVFKIK